MKVLEFVGDVEKHLIAVIDTALKSSGMSILSSVDYIRNMIKEAEAKSAEKPEAK